MKEIICIVYIYFVIKVIYIYEMYEKFMFNLVIIIYM